MDIERPPANRTRLPTEPATHHINSIAPPVAVPRMPIAMPRSRRGHHWEIILMAGLQQAALTNPAIPQGMAKPMAELAKLVTQLKSVVSAAPQSTHSRRPYASASRPWQMSPRPNPQSKKALINPISTWLRERSSCTSGAVGQKLNRPR